MEAAELLFAEQGFNGTSVRDISEKAHVNLAMISYYFGSKEKLLESLFQYRGEATKLTLESILSKTGISSLEKVFMLIEMYMDKMFRQQCFHRIMAREQVLNTTGTTADLILQMKKTNQQIISKLVHEGQKTGEFKKNIDIPLMMATIVGTANNMVTTKHYYKEMNNLQDLPEEEFEKLIRKKLGAHLKFIVKALLTQQA